MVRSRSRCDFFVPRRIGGWGAIAALFACALAILAPPAWANLRVVLDPGHGGHDKGANYYGVREKDLNLDLAKRVAAILKQHKGISPVLTRTSDRFVSLEDRAALSNRYGNTVFVSIHFNASLNRAANGIETYYYGSANGRRLASSIQSSLMERIRTTNRGVKSRAYKVLHTTRAPAALVECGFLSNSWERNRCASPAFREILAQQIAKGILNYDKRR